MNIPIPSIITVTRSIAVLPDLVRETVGFSLWDHGRLVSVLAGDQEEGDEEFGHEDHDVLKPWEAGRRALEFVMLIRGQDEFHKDFHEVMGEAVPEIDGPQYALDVIMALAGMLSAVADEDDIAMFSRGLIEAEARAQ